MWKSLDQAIAAAGRAISTAEHELARVIQQLRKAHTTQEGKYLSLQQQNQEASKALEARANAEREVAAASALQQQKTEALAELAKLQDERKALKAAYILTRDKISELREGVAKHLQAEAGAKVRIRVQRNADVLEYQQQLLNALYGSKLKNQEDILRTLCGIRPEDLALLLREDDFAEFETQTSFGKERGRKILEGSVRTLIHWNSKSCQSTTASLLNSTLPRVKMRISRMPQSYRAATNALLFCRGYSRGTPSLSSTSPRIILITTSSTKP